MPDAVSKRVIADASPVFVCLMRGEFTMGLNVSNGVARRDGEENQAVPEDAW